MLNIFHHINQLTFKMLIIYNFIYRNRMYHRVYNIKLFNYILCDILFIIYFTFFLIYLYVHEEERIEKERKSNIK